MFEFCAFASKHNVIIFILEGEANALQVGFQNSKLFLIVIFF